MSLQPVTLRGRRVRLEPLSLSHCEGLAAVAFDERIWTWTQPRMRTPGDVRAYVETALQEQAASGSLPFATVLADSGQPVGCTRFFNVSREHRRLEIGWTWLAPAWQRTAVNTEAKLLMLTHAFEALGCGRVEFKTDARNEASRAAILRLGATQEGIFRKHMVMPDGRVRDSVYFSITDDEWPVIKARLEIRLG